MQPPFIPTWQELRPFVAELWLVATIVAVLLTPFFVRRPNSACGLVALVGMAAAVASLIWAGPEKAAGRFEPMLAADGVAFLWKLILLLFTVGVVLLWFTATAPSMHEGDGPEFFVLLLGATFGMALMGSAANLLMLFLAVEAASLPSYVLAGFRKTHKVGAEASVKYVLFGAVSSAMMVYGLSLLYGLCGTLRLYPSALDPGVARRVVEILATHGASPLLVVALFGVICGLGFKISAVPFHFWCPDVFEGASIDVTAFLSVASKGAGLVLLLRVAMAIADAAGYQPTGATTGLAAVIGVLGALTCTIGNTAAYAQNNLKRLLAYSSIAHAGYMMCAVSLLVRRDPALARLGDTAAQALLLYLAVYLFMNLGAFTVAAVVRRQSGNEDLSAFAGLGRRSPILAACMTVFLFSLIGLPPLAGFTAKFAVLQLLIVNGGWWWALAAVVGVNTVLSVYYYARVVKAMYLRSSDAAPFAAPMLGRWLSGACAVALVVLFVGAGPLTRLTTQCGRLRRADLPAAVRATAASGGEIVPVPLVAQR